MKKSIIIILLLMAATMSWAVPARRDPFTRVQPNGDSITVVLVGDEAWHANYTVDGYLIAENSKGWWCYAKWSKDTYTDMRGHERPRVVATRKHVKDEAKRSCCHRRWLIKHGVHRD